MNRTCATCAGPIPATRRSHAVRCSQKCRDRASYLTRARLTRLGRVVDAAHAAH